MKNENPTAVITGGANGIGREIAFTFDEKGYTVIIADRDGQSGEEVAEEIRTGGDKAFFHHIDISVPDEIPGLMKTAFTIAGRLDLVVNNAGFGVWVSPDLLTLEEWNSVIDTNLRGAFLCSREAAGYMRKRGGGNIINIASTRAFMSEPFSEAYAASKGGLIALTHALAASYSGDNIRVNCISPGWIETGDYSALRETDHRQHFSGRVGKPSDIAEACIFLVNSGFINGENLIIDGGMTRKMIYEE